MGAQNTANPVVTGDSGAVDSRLKTIEGLYGDKLMIRSFGIPDIRAVDDNGEGLVEGHPAVFDQKTLIGGYFYEIIQRGAFQGCNFDDVVFTANHDLRNVPLARSRRNNKNSTLQLDVDNIGLHIMARLDVENNGDSCKLYSAVQRGDIDGMSFIFYVGEERWEDLDQEIPTRYITRFAEVREVSAVNFPAYAGTDINARQSHEALENARLALENARASQVELENSDERSELELAKAKLLLH